MRRKFRPKRRYVFKPQRPLKRARFNRSKTVLSKAHIGEPVGSSCTKKFQSGAINTYGTRDLFMSSLTACARGADINDRLSDTINIRGFSVRTVIQSHANILLNMAVVAVKDPDVTGLVTKTDFFRYAFTTRAVDFSIALSAAEFHLYPLNSDKFTVLKHDRCIMAEDFTGATPYVKTIDWWVPLNRQVTYKDDTSGSCNDNIFVIWWMDYPTALPASAGGAGAADIQVLACTEFRETIN